MYCYIRSKSEPLWVVGFYKLNGVWEPESDHATKEEAAKRVHWLNGGNEDAAAERQAEALEGIYDILAKHYGWS